MSNFILVTTIALDYARSWGVWEALREIYQNWVDEGTDEERKRLRDGRYLIFENEGEINRGNFVLGNSKKTGNKVYRGEFGEGFKMGAIAMLQEGRKMEIISGDRRWVPVKAESIAALAAQLAMYVAGVVVESML